MGKLLTLPALARTILVKGTLNTLLGLVHIIGTFTFESRHIAGQGTALLRRDYLMWFTATGVFILFLGLVDLACHGGLKSGEPLARRIAALDAVFTLITGAVGVAVFGISPPLVLLATGLVGLLALAAGRQTGATGR
jgi:hypothetical protein